MIKISEILHSTYSKTQLIYPDIYTCLISMSSWAFHLFEFILYTIIIHTPVSSCKNVGWLAFVNMLGPFFCLGFYWCKNSRIKKIYPSVWYSLITLLSTCRTWAGRKVFFNKYLLHTSTSIHIFTTIPIATLL